MIELYRRLFLLIGVTVAVCMAMFADLAPRVSVERMDFAREQKNYGHRWMFSEKNRYLVSLPLDKFIRENVKGREIPQDDAVWQSFAEEVGDILGNTSEGSKWPRRLGPDSTLWYKLKESPLDSLAERFSAVPEKTLFLPYDIRVSPRFVRSCTLRSLHIDKLSI